MEPKARVQVHARVNAKGDTQEEKSTGRNNGYFRIKAKYIYIYIYTHIYIYI